MTSVTEEQSRDGGTSEPKPPSPAGRGGTGPSASFLGQSSISTDTLPPSGDSTELAEVLASDPVALPPKPEVIFAQTLSAALGEPRPLNSEGVGMAQRRPGNPSPHPGMSFSGLASRREQPFHQVRIFIPGGVDDDNRIGWQGGGQPIDLIGGRRWRQPDQIELELHDA